MARRLAAIMFTDIAGYTALTQTDESGALRLLHEQRELCRPLLEAHQGREVKSMGDGLLIEFPDVLDAVNFGVELLSRVHERNVLEKVRPLLLRVGIHLGDVQSEGTDILGDAVNIASRVEPMADPEGVCVSEPVYAQVHNKVPFRFDRLGPRYLRGVAEPIHLYRVVLPWTDAKAAAGSALLPRLAVLPLVNIGPDAKDEYFVDGLTEELTSVLSQIRGLRVIARTSVGQFKGTTKTIAQIGSELAVSSVLEGSVRKAGNQLRITVQLIDVKSEEHRWSQSYDGTLENIFKIQGEVAERTAAALKVELLKSEREAVEEGRTSNLAAYEAYLRGIQASRQFVVGGRRSGEFDREAVLYLNEAIQRDPQFAAAHAYLASHLIGSMGVTRPGSEVFPRARELVTRALELSPGSSEAHAARGNLAVQADLDWGRAESEFQQAIDLNPSGATARFWYGSLLEVLQRFPEAKKQYHAAVDLDPLWLLPRRGLVTTEEFSGDMDAAITLCESLARNFREEGWFRGQLVWLYALAGRIDEAVRQLDALAGGPDPVFRVWHATTLALLGQPEEARALLADWENGTDAGYVSASRAAMFCSMLGEQEKALTILERDYRDGDRSLWAHYRSACFDPIRGDPRFIKLLGEMHLPTRTPWRRGTVPVRSSP